MQREEVRRIFEERVYASLQEGGVTVSEIPADKLRALVRALGDGLFAVVDGLEDEATAGPALPESGAPGLAVEEGGHAEPPDPAVERPLWRGRPYLTIGTVYELTSQRLRVLKGILSNTVDEIELVRIKDTRVKQHMGERMLNVGDVSIFSADANTPALILENVHDPLAVRELVRKAVMDEKSRRGLYYREDIGS